jgi:site-specific recombinase XerC
MPRNGNNHRGGLPPEKYLEPEQLAAFREYVRARAQKRKSRLAHTDEIIVEILAGSGLRAEELCALTIRDVPIDYNTPDIHVRDGKGNVSRTVNISTALRDRIREYTAAYRAGAPPTAPLIESRTGKAMAYRTLHHKIRLLGEEAKLPKRLKPHALRHSYAVLAYQKTSDLLWLKDQLGHARVETTTIYAKTASRQRRANAEALE